MPNSMNFGTNGGRGGLITHMATRLEQVLSDRLAEADREFEKLFEDTHHEGSTLALQMAKLCAVAKLAARQIAAFGWDKTPVVDGVCNNQGEEQLCNLFMDLLTGERNNLHAESRKRI